MTGTAHSHILWEIFTYYIPYYNIMSGGVLFWGEPGEKSMMDIYQVIARGDNK